MLVNANFGCGSSREHAPQAIRRRGIRAVIGQSFSEIFFGNSVVMGLPCPTASAETLAALQTAVEQDPSTEIVVDLSTMRVTAAGQSYELSMPPAAREAFLDGSWDATGLLLESFDEVGAVASRLPYVSGEWRSALIAATRTEFDEAVLTRRYEDRTTSRNASAARLRSPVFLNASRTCR